MLILALDTATRAGSSALVRGDVLLHEQPGDMSQSHAARLPGDLMALLDRHGVTLKDVDCYAVATGPGSFTGLRVGIATMQGLSFDNQKPLIGVSAFDALARIGSGAGAGGGTREGRAVERPVSRKSRESTPYGPSSREATPRIAAWIDAWRGEVYAAAYENGRQIEPPVVAAPSHVLPRLRGGATRFIGDGAERFRAEIHEALGADAEMADPTVPLLAATIARLAAEAAAQGHRPPPHAIRPLYVRRPDAELSRDARPNR
jgi:tRNA threonylcarbamoyladenosine biosynthesis protein TsaB